MDISIIYLENKYDRMIIFFLRVFEFMLNLRCISHND